ncbi:ParA family protein, partial [Ferviditalea candida]|nr:ParA family protein [Paenibacillaceae bacterium T2]
ANPDRHTDVGDENKKPPSLAVPNSLSIKVADDSMPSLGMLTINALASADSVIIPVQAHYLPAKGMTQLLQTIARVRRQINPKLVVDGVLLTMVDSRTRFAKDISFVLRRDYSDKLRVFVTEIPLSVRAAETSAKGRSIYVHDPSGQAAKAYAALTKEVQGIGSERRHARPHQADHSR